MTQATLDLIHRAYQDALEKSENILQVIENLYDQLDKAEVIEKDIESFDSFVDGLRGCLQYRRKTFVITNTITYINITFMYIILWLNSTQDKNIDINWQARRKSLESDLTKILSKCDSNLSANIRDRFGVRGIVLNQKESQTLIYDIYDAITGILGGKNRKMYKDFYKWIHDNSNISFSDKDIVYDVLKIPFSIDYVKDYIKNPKENGYQSLQFTMTIQMYSEVLPGCQFEVQLRNSEMHKNCVSGTATHDQYKHSDHEEIDKVFVVDDFSKLNITGFTSYDNSQEDNDGIHFAKIFSSRRISATLVTQ